MEAVFDGPVAAQGGGQLRGAGLGGVSEVMAYTVSADHFLAGERPAAAHDLDGLGGGVGEGQPGGDGGDFQDAPFVPPVAAGQIN